MMSSPGGGRGSSNAATGPATQRAARDRQRVTAGKRGNIRKILRMIDKGIKTRLYTGIWKIGELTDSKQSIGF
jgi:hypothetical protein